MEPQSILKRPSKNKMEIEEDKPEPQPQLKIDLTTPPHVSWDEPTLAEHLKLKGTYMKISQPKTPYHKPPGQGFEPEPFLLNEEEQEIEASLQQASANKQRNQKGKLNLKEINEQLMKEIRDSGGMSEEQEEEDEATRRKREEFKKKRDMHYGGEFHRQQNWHQEHDDDQQ